MPEMIEANFDIYQDSETIDQLTHGEAPQNKRILEELSVGIDFITDFWRDRYLKEFLPAGGSKIKFITGKSGSGKTHTVYLLTEHARKENLLTVSFSAKKVWLNDFKNIYLEILEQCDLPQLLKKCSHKIIQSMGFDYQEIPEGMTFMDYLSQKGLSDGLTRRELRLQLKNLFLDNPLLDNNFALACSLLCGGILGHPFLENQSRQLLLSWLNGDKSVKVATLRPLGLAPSRITKYNARHMLRSLTEIIRFSGYAGLFVAVDNLEILLNRSSLNPMHYTKMKRDDTYESIRQLIDDIDSFHNLMFVFSFERSLLDNDNSGIKSYQALWMRIQNEIVETRINKFSDIMDLDSIGSQLYTPEMLVEMSNRLAKVMNGIDLNARTIDKEKACHIIELSKLGKLSIPRLVNQSTLQTSEGEPI